MYLKSKIELTFNSGMTGTKTGIVIGSIESFMRSGDCTKLGANYIYAEFESEEKSTIIEKNAFHLNSAEEIQAMYDIIKNDLPSTDDEPLYERTKIYLAFRLKMLETFLPMNEGLTIEDIEIIS